MEFRRDRYYWIRFKFTPTLWVARPSEIRENKVTWWSVPWHSYISPVKGDHVECLQEIPLPEGYDRDR